MAEPELGGEHLRGWRVRDYDDLITRLGNNRRSRNWSLNYVAERTGRRPTAGQGWLWMVEHGKTVPSAVHLFELADALGFDLALIPREPS